MPEVFENEYTFTAGSVPAAEAFADRLAAQFGKPLEAEVQEIGFHGAPRAYARFHWEKMDIWVFWESERPEVQIRVDEPMERMIPINAAVIALGGKPHYVDGWWRLRRHQRTWRLIRRLFGTACTIAVAVAIVWYLHWWGLLLVFGLLGGAACLYTIALARAFSNR